MKNYTCYELDFFDELRLKAFDKRYEGLENNDDFIGLSKLDYQSARLIRESYTYRSVLDQKRAHFADTDQKRVFISHKKKDKDIALALAKKLDRKGIAYWLDVLDPQLIQLNQSSSRQKAVAIANIIELALLNCTDVVAIITNHSSTSQWIPYEYGRVKEPKLQVENAYALTHNLTYKLPEYMYLGNVCNSQNQLIEALEKQAQLVY